MIEIKNVCKRFKDTEALKNINIEINDYELFGLLGVNGAGKSTLIKILAGLIKPSYGEIKIDGLDFSKDRNKIKKIINVAFQESSIASNLTIYENLELISKLYNVFDKEKINNIIEELGLMKFKNKKAKLLSGGYQKRLSIALCMITEPKIIILDEPTAGLDIIARKELWRIIKKINEKSTIVLTTHYLEEAEFLCDRMAILKDGKLLAIGSVDELKKIGNDDDFSNAFINIAEGKC